MSDSNIIGKKGYKKTGHFSGLVGTIEKEDGRMGLKNLFVIRFKNGGGVVASEKDIQLIEE